MGYCKGSINEVDQTRKSECGYLNMDFRYDIIATPWQMIRPSFLFFLNTVLPMEHGPFGTKEILQIAEIGVAGGMNALLMLKAYNKTFLHLVDNYGEGQQAKEMLRAIEPYKERTKFIYKKSLEAAKEYSDEFFDYVYIDAGHEYKDVTEDLTAWYPKVKFNGMLAGHDWMDGDVRQAVFDYLQNTPQRLWAVQRYFKEKRHSYLTDEEDQGADWWFIKRASIGNFT